MLVDLHSPGPGSNHFRGLTAGDGLTYHGPYGAFTIRDTKPPRAVLVADGVGVGPIRSLLRSMLANGDTPFPITLVHEASVANGLAYRTEFERWNGQVPTFTYIPTVPGGESDWHGETRDLGELVPTLYDEPAEDSTPGYLCGSGLYTDPLKAWLTDGRASDEAVTVERFFD